ncbi:MAG: hypothetical protein JWO07_841 [Candidatus Saccharibacteria bacterium]|nr:hypothetical protein [Candidatus Saccharibacteria bacterium]
MRELQELLNYKFKNTPFRVWHYYVVLTILYIVLPLLPSSLSQSGGSLFILVILMAAFSTLRQLIGHRLARQGMDSVLVMRYFVAIPWVLMAISSAVALQIGSYTGTLHGFYVFLFWLGIAATAFHGLGIFIHYKKRKLTYKNIKKEDLFQ